MTNDDQSRLRYQTHRVAQHLRWARTEGVAKLIEEDQLNPRERFAMARAKRRWLREAARPRHQATAVFLVGLQRSGTNMMLRGLEACPEFEVHNENDNATFERFRLRFDAVAPVVSDSRSNFVLFKPLCDSHDALRLLALPDLPKPPRAIWAYRGVDDRVRSSVAKFGDANKLALAEIASSGDNRSRWEAGGLDAEAFELIRSLDPSTLSAQSASALFWYLRNRLLFTLGLDHRADVIVTGYDDFTAAPEASMRSLCDFLGFNYSDALIAHVDSRSGGKRDPLELAPRVRELCDELGEALTAASHQIPASHGS